jgi:hypothetical protein
MQLMSTGACLTKEELSQAIGRKVRAGLSGIGISQVIGILDRHERSLESNEDTWFVRVEENEETRDIDIDPWNVVLLPEKKDVQQTQVGFNQTEIAVIQTVFEASISPWNSQSVFNWIVSVLGVNQGHEFLVKIGIAEPV